MSDLLGFIIAIFWLVMPFIYFIIFLIMMYALAAMVARGLDTLHSAGIV